MKNKTPRILTIAVVLLTICACFYVLKTSSIEGFAKRDHTAPVSVAQVNAGEPATRTHAAQPTSTQGGGSNQHARGADDSIYFVEFVIKNQHEAGGQLVPAIDRRIILKPNELVHIDLSGRGLNPHFAVELRADNGGLLNDQELRPQIAASPGARFSFRAGGDRGLYTVTVSQQNRTETLEFWVGSEPPHGEAGPVRNFTAPTKG